MIELITILYRIRRTNPQTGSVEITHRARLISHSPTNAAPSSMFNVIPLRGAREGNRLRSQDQMVNGETISVTQHSHCVGWVLARSIIDPTQGSADDFDSVLAEWAVDAESKAAWRASVADLYHKQDAPQAPEVCRRSWFRRVKLDVASKPTAPVESEIEVEPPVPIDWGKLARPVTDIDEQRAPVAERRAPFWRRWMRLGAR